MNGIDRRVGGGRVSKTKQKKKSNFSFCIVTHFSLFAWGRRSTCSCPAAPSSSSSRWWSTPWSTSSWATSSTARRAPSRKEWSPCLWRQDPPGCRPPVNKYIYIPPLPSISNSILVFFKRCWKCNSSSSSRPLGVCDTIARLLDPAATTTNSSRWSGRRVWWRRAAAAAPAVATLIRSSRDAGSITRPRSTTWTTGSRSRRGNGSWCPSSPGAVLAIQVRQIQVLLYPFARYCRRRWMRPISLGDGRRIMRRPISYDAVPCSLALDVWLTSCKKLSLSLQLKRGAGTGRMGWKRGGNGISAASPTTAAQRPIRRLAASH